MQAGFPCLHFSLAAAPKSAEECKSPLSLHGYHFPMTTDEKRTKGIPLSDIKPSQHRRAFWKQYREPGLYMITIAIEGRAPLFGELAGHCRAARCTPEFPHLVPSTLGHLILEQEIPKIHHFYPQVEVWKAALMPDHLHLLLRVTATLPREHHLGDVISSFKGGCSRAWWSLQESERAAGQEAALFLAPNTQRCCGLFFEKVSPLLIKQSWLKKF